MKTTADLIIDNLTQQVAKLAQEKAVLNALLAQKEYEIQELKESPAEE